MIRRCIALLVLVCFGLFSVEAVIADVCDGDATAAEIAKAPLGGLIESSPTAPASDGSSAPSSPHAVHVCHCVHGHGNLASMVLALGELPVIHAIAVTGDVLAPPAVNADLHLRPPIA